MLPHQFIKLKPCFILISPHIHSPFKNLKKQIFHQKQSIPLVGKVKLSEDLKEKERKQQQQQTVLQMVFSTFHLLNYTYQGYVIVATLTLLFSYSSNRFFFIFSATSWVILKTITLYCSKSKKSKGNKGNLSSSSSQGIKQSGNKNSKIIRVFKTIFSVDSLFNSSGQNRFGILIATIIFIVFQEILVWSQLKNVQTSSLEYMNSLYSQQFINVPSSEIFIPIQDNNNSTIHHSFLDYSLHLNLFHLLFISQIFIGILLKSACALNVFLGISEEPLNKLDFWNLISYFLSLSSLHGLFGMIYNLEPSLIQYLVIFRVIIVIIETAIIHAYKMNFFSSFPQKPLKVGATLSLVQIFLMFPIDYSPFYAGEWKINDYKTSDMYTQTSRFMVKISQTFETVFLMYLCYQTKSEGQFIMQGLLGFFYFSGFCTLILSICHFYIKTKEIITKDYQFLKSSAMTVAKTIRILNNSKKIMILVIENISDSTDNLENNFTNQQLLLRGLLKHTKQSTSQEFSCITIAQIAQSFKINANYICIQATTIFDSAFFSELADPTRPLPFCRLRISEEKQFCLSLQKSLILRLFAEGVREETKKFIDIQHPTNKVIGQKTVNWYLRGYFAVIVFEKNLSHMFVINPKQVLHDLWFDDETMKYCKT